MQRFKKYYFSAEGPFTSLFRLKPSPRCSHFLLFQKTVLLINFIIEVQNNKNSAEICGTMSRYLSQPKQKLDNFKINIFASKYEPVHCTVEAFDILRLYWGPALSLFIV